MTRVLVPVEILEGETVSSGLMNLLGTMDVTVLGYHVLPEQTPPDQARLQLEDRANEALDDLCEEFRAAGGAADHRLVFTHDREQTINRTADELDTSAFAISGTTGDVDRLLVAVSETNVDRVLTFVEELVGDRTIDVTLLFTGVDDEDIPDSLAAGPDRLRAAGLDVTTERPVDGSTFDMLLDLVPGHDVIVIGEKAPSLRSLVFGDEAQRVAKASVGPVVVVRRDRTDESPE